MNIAKINLIHSDLITGLNILITKHEEANEQIRSADKFIPKG